MPIFFTDLSFDTSRVLKTVTGSGRLYPLLLSQFQRKREYLFLDYLSKISGEGPDWDDSGLADISDPIMVAREENSDWFGCVICPPLCEKGRWSDWQLQWVWDRDSQKKRRGGGNRLIWTCASVVRAVIFEIGPCKRFDKLWSTFVTSSTLCLKQRRKTYNWKGVGGGGGKTHKSLRMSLSANYLIHPGGYCHFWFSATVKAFLRWEFLFSFSLSFCLLGGQKNRKNWDRSSSSPLTSKHCKWFLIYYCK